MKKLMNFFIATSSPAQATPVLTNPSEVLRVNRDEITGTLELIPLNQTNHSRFLRVSWIKKDETKGVMKTVWVNDEMVVL